MVIGRHGDLQQGSRDPLAKTRPAVYAIESNPSSSIGTGIEALMKNLALLAFSFCALAVALAQTTATPPAPPFPAPTSPALSSSGTYQPKSASDKARSDTEFAALAYMRTTAVAEKLYHRKHNKYTDSLQSLVGSGSFTKRMANPNRGDYTVTYRPTKPDGYALVITPKQFEVTRRSFYIDETGGFRVEEDKQATEKSAPLK
jgi:hypothetical protein